MKQVLFILPFLATIFKTVLLPNLIRTAVPVLATAAINKLTGGPPQSPQQAAYYDDDTEEYEEVEEYEDDEEDYYE